MSEIIPNGTLVTWWNATARGPKHKTGVILAYVPAGKSPYDALGRFLEPNERAPLKHLHESKNARYLVAVPRVNSKLIDIYTPYISQVVIVPTEEG